MLRDGEPTTEAGRRLLDGFGPMPRPDAQELDRRSAMGRRVKLLPAILAIEAEARAMATAVARHRFVGRPGNPCIDVCQLAEDDPIHRADR